MILDRITGTPDNTNLQQRILNLLVFLGLVQGFYFLVSDSVVGLAPGHLVFDLLALGLFSVLFYRVRFRGNFRLGIHVTAVAGLLLSVFNFFVNAGIHGPGLLVILVVLGFINILHSHKAGLTYTLLGVALTAGGMAVQVWRPDWIEPYGSPAMQYLDIWFTFVLCAAVLVLVVRMVMQFFTETLREARNLQALAAQSEKMAALGEMVAGISHEIGTPVGILGTVLGLSREWWGTGPLKLRDALAQVSPGQREAFWALLEAGLKVAGEPLPDSKTLRVRKELLAARMSSLPAEVRRSLVEDLAALNLEAWNPDWGVLTADRVGLEAWSFAVTLLMLERSNRNALVAYEKVRRLVTSLGAYSRFAQPDEVPIPTDLSEGIDAVLTLYAARRDDVEIRRNFLPVPQVLAKPEDLIQVWTNLVQNALQAMGGRGTLAIDLEARGPWVAVVLSDSGPGVPAELRDKIFAPFFTTKERGLGTGLGLGIVRRIVAAHGGTVAVDVAPGGGARFTVLLPAILSS